MVLLRLYIRVLLVIVFSVSGCIAAEKYNSGSDQLDEQDQQEFNVRIDRANACTKSRDFACAEQQLGQAKKYANGSRDRGVLKKAMENLELQRQLALRDDAKRKYSNERSTVEANAENTEKELAESRRASVANADAEIRRADAAMERQHVKDQQSLSEYKAALWGNLQNDINRSWAQAEAGSRGSSIEEDRAKAKRLAEFNDNISQMEADPNSDLNRDKRAREREREKDRAALQRADSERAAKRDAAKKVALANDAKRVSDERTQADAAANARKKQQADELKAQQEREKQRLDAERRSQELREIAERKRVAAAEEARQKAEKEREAQAEKQARNRPLHEVEDDWPPYKMNWAVIARGDHMATREASCSDGKAKVARKLATDKYASKGLLSQSPCLCTKWWNDEPNLFVRGKWQCAILGQYTGKTTAVEK